jgi:hypothetical protein
MKKVVKRKKLIMSKDTKKTNQQNFLIGKLSDLL